MRCKSATAFPSVSNVARESGSSADVACRMGAPRSNGRASRMKRSGCVAGALLLLPSLSFAQDINPQPGFYLGAGAGIENFINTTTSIGGTVAGSVGFGLGALI